MSNSRWASISSRPLFTSVAEFTVTTGPMDHVGWASASATVMPASCSVDRPRNGPPGRGQDQLGHLVARFRRASTGPAPSVRNPPARSGPAAAALVTRDPPATNDSLLASASVRPAAERGHRRAETDRSGDPVEHHVALDGGDEFGRRLRAGEHRPTGQVDPVRCRHRNERVRMSGRPARPVGRNGRRRRPGPPLRIHPGDRR